MKFLQILTVFFIITVFNTSYADVSTEAISSSNLKQVIPPNFHKWSSAKKRKLIKKRIQELIILDRELGITLNEINTIGLRILDNICKFETSTLEEAIQLAEYDIRDRIKELSQAKPEMRKKLTQALSISRNVLKQLKINHVKAKRKTRKCK